MTFCAPIAGNKNGGGGRKHVQMEGTITEQQVADESYANMKVHVILLQPNKNAVYFNEQY